jgi:hypothetical protein
MVALCLQYQWIKAEPPEDPSSIKQRKKKSKTILSNFGRKMTVKVHLALNTFSAVCHYLISLKQYIHVLQHTYADLTEAAVLRLSAGLFDFLYVS